MRIGSANSVDTIVDRLSSAQSRIGELQQQVSTGVRVQKPSDDPAAMAQAERARTRLERLQITQRTLQSQRNTLEQTESALGDANDLMQSARDVMVSAQNPALSASDRKTLATQLRSLREQLLGVANRRDSDGLALFGGLATQNAPFMDSTSGVSYQGSAGQAVPTAETLPQSMDGANLWLNAPSGNGTFVTTPAAGNTGGAWADAGQVSDPSALTGHDYQVSFSVSGSTTTYSVSDTTSGTTLVSGQPWQAGQSISFDGISFTARGAPANGDSLDVKPSQRTDIFATLARTADAIESGKASLPGEVARGEFELDSALNRILAGRSLAGEWLKRADAMDQMSQLRTVQQETVLSAAQDLDMVKGISDLQSAQTGMDAAMKSYLQMQKLSLFNYISS